MKQQNRKRPLVFYVCLALMCVVLFSFHLMGGLFARYTTQASGSDGARVARFAFSDNLDAQSQTIPMSIGPGESMTTQISIQNDGEVAIRYVVKIENLTHNLPIEDQIITSDVLAVNANGSFEWTVAWDKEMNSVEQMGKMDIIRFVVTVEQVA